MHIAFPPTVDGVNYYGSKEIVKWYWLVGLWYWTYVKPNQLIWCLHLVVSDTEACCLIYIPVWAWLSLYQNTSTKDSNWIDSLSGWESTFTSWSAVCCYGETYHPITITLPGQNMPLVDTWIVRTSSIYGFVCLLACFFARIIDFNPACIVCIGIHLWICAS